MHRRRVRDEVGRYHPTWLEQARDDSLKWCMQREISRTRHANAHFANTALPNKDLARSNGPVGPVRHRSTLSGKNTSLERRNDHLITDGKSLGRCAPGGHRVPPDDSLSPASECAVSRTQRSA